MRGRVSFSRRRLSLIHDDSAAAKYAGSPRRCVRARLADWGRKLLDFARKMMDGLPRFQPPQAGGFSPSARISRATRILPEMPIRARARHHAARARWRFRPSEAGCRWFCAAQADDHSRRRRHFVAITQGRRHSVFASAQLL